MINSYYWDEVLPKLSLNRKFADDFCDFYFHRLISFFIIGSIPLTAGVLAGNTILTVAVLTIMITAPLGAIGIDHLHSRLLKKMINNINLDNEMP